MKKTIKYVLLTLAVGITSVFAFMASGCHIKDEIDKVIEQVQCTHQWNEGEETKPATCKEKGAFTKTCTLCGGTQTTELDVVAHTEMAIKAVEATCTKPGATNGIKCGVCGTVLVAPNAIPAKGHTVVVDEEISATCEAAGKTEGAHCSVCNQVLVAQEEIPATGHSMKELVAYAATCETTGYTGGEKCENCDKTTTGEILPALGHDWGGGMVDRDPTCLAEGEMTYYCVTCGDTKKQTLAIVEHEYENGTCRVCGMQQFDFSVEGKWVLKDKLISDKEFFQVVNFTAGGTAYQSIGWKYNAGMGWYVGAGDSQTLNDVLYQTVDPTGGENVGWIVDAQVLTFKTLQGVSKEFYDWLEVNGFRTGVSYELQGIWKFKEQIDLPEDLFYETFDYAFGFDYFYTMYMTDTTALWAMSEDITLGTEGYVKLYEEGSGWTDAAYRTIQFDGTTTVSEEFYKWFISNADEQVMTFSIDGTTYQALSGMTWERWCNSVYNTAGFFYEETNEESMIYRADSDIDGTYYYVTGGFGWVDREMPIFGAGMLTAYQTQEGQAGNHSGGVN